METLNNRKRKKRKTRRCLDELRKKTYQKSNSCKISKNIDVKLLKNQSNCIKNNYITNNRLTLFNKAVRSETITRLQLGELEVEKFKVNKDREIISNLCTKHVSNKEHNHFNKTNLGKQNTLIRDNSSEVEIFSPNINGGKVSNDSPKSVILFSPESQNGEAVNTLLESQLEISLNSSSSLSTIRTNFESNTYDDIMENVEYFIEQDYPQFLKSVDVSVRKTKKELLKLYLENNTKSEITDNVINTVQYSSPDAQNMQNTRDYISHSWSQCSESKTSGILLSSLTGSNSSISMQSPSASSIVSAVYDTPEYSYYPHRLN